MINTTTMVRTIHDFVASEICFDKG